MEKLLLFLQVLFACEKNSQQPGSVINFSGYTWTIKGGTELGPGPNVWGAKNAWVDSKGFLHLKLSYDARTSQWICAGVTSTVNLGYGTYQWQVQGPISKLDKNVVAGLFHYDGPDGFNEIDIEFARWGDNTNPNVNYSVYPAAETEGAHQQAVFQWSQKEGDFSTHRYTWTSNSVVFKSMNGFYNDDTNMFFNHTFSAPAVSIPTAVSPVKMNLWCFRGMGPSDGKDVEIIIRSFKFTPEL